jgi:hypothetical protein
MGLRDSGIRSSSPVVCIKGATGSAVAKPFVSVIEERPVLLREGVWDLAPIPVGESLPGIVVDPESKSW